MDGFRASRVVISANINSTIAVISSLNSSLYDLQKPRYDFSHFAITCAILIAIYGMLANIPNFTTIFFYYSAWSNWPRTIEKLSSLSSAYTTTSAPTLDGIFHLFCNYGLSYEKRLPHSIPSAHPLQGVTAWYEGVPKGVRMEEPIIRKVLGKDVDMQQEKTKHDFKNHQWLD